MTELTDGAGRVWKKNFTSAPARDSTISRLLDSQMVNDLCVYENRNERLEAFFFIFFSLLFTSFSYSFFWCFVSFNYTSQTTHDTVECAPEKWDCIICVMRRWLTWIFFFCIIIHRFATQKYNGSCTCWPIGERDFHEIKFSLFPRSDRTCTIYLRSELSHTIESWRIWDFSPNANETRSRRWRVEFHRRGDRRHVQLKIDDLFSF